MESKMSTFHEGQEVEVHVYHPRTSDRPSAPTYTLRKAKIVSLPHTSYSTQHQVQFPDGTRAVFDAAHIRAIEQECAHSASITTADGEGAYCRDCGETAA
jgi:hypothetical protein